MAERRCWRKVLYERQPYPDNYCGDDFLCKLRKNGKRFLSVRLRSTLPVTAVTYTYAEAVGGALRIVNQLSLFTLYVTLASHVDQSHLNCVVLLLTLGTVAAVIYALTCSSRGDGRVIVLFEDQSKTRCRDLVPPRCAKSCHVCVVVLGCNADDTHVDAHD